MIFSKTMGKGRPMQRIIKTGIILFIMVTIAGISGSAGAADIDISISKHTLQRLFDIMMPYQFKTKLMAGQEADVKLTNPEVTLTPGTPGAVHVAMDLNANANFMGLPPIVGRVNPRADIQYDTAKGQLRIRVKGLNVKGIPLDPFIEPIYMPLTDNKPIKLRGKQIKVQPRAARTKVTEQGLVLMLDYSITQIK